MKKFLRSAEYHIKNTLWKIFGLFASKEVPLAPLPLDFSKISKVLVIRSDRLGDVVLSTPVYESLKSSFPHLKITAMVNPIQGGILQDNPNLHKIILMRRRRFWRAIRDSRREKFDLAITLNKKFSATATFFTLCSNAKMIAGYIHPQNPWKYHIRLPIETPPRHEIENNLALLEHMGVPEIIHKPRIYFSARDENRINEIMNSGKRERPLLLVKTGTRIPEWGWQWNKFQEVMEHILKNKIADIWLINGPEEEEGLRSNIAEMQFQPRLLPLVKTKELALLIQQCDLLFCNHTGIMHLASAVEKPACVIFKHGEIERWGPRHPNSIILDDRHQDNLEPETVINTLENFLKSEQICHEQPKK
ncbi:MAG: glycosyltransferase family 9 protein [Nitrospinae bacterium]|nr:glycosyltransferase family 9 protein [Nitrospinota bacterium]